MQVSQPLNVPKQSLINSQAQKSFNGKFQGTKPSPFYSPQLIVTRCPSSNEAQCICISKGCEKPSFICFSKDCEHCGSHKNCTFIRVDYIFSSLKNKEQRTSSDVVSVFEKIIQLYEKAIQTLVQQIEQLREMVTLYGLQPYQCTFLKLIRSGRQSEIKSELAEKVYYGIESPSPIINNIEKMASSLQSMGQLENLFSRRLKNFIDTVEAYYLRSHNLDSQIVSDKSQLLRFFNKSVGNFKLLYRASQHNFRAKAFHSACDGIKNTLVLIRTEHDKIIGGFTPIPWSEQTGNKADPSLQSFLFSVTEKEKYVLKDTSNAIRCYSDQGPCFGEPTSDIYICNEANTSASSNFNFPHSYNTIDGKYKERNQTTFRLFSGANDGWKCRLKEWEVFQIQMLDS